MAAATLAALVLLVSLAPGVARAEPGLQFLEPEPVVIDLDRLPDVPRWLVRVFQGQPNGPHTLQLHVVFRPAGVIQVEEPMAAAVRTGDVVAFAIELDRRVEGAGELVVTSSDGAVARRAISTADPERGDGPLPSRLRFAGTALRPFGGVGVGAVEAAGLPGTSSSPVRVGTIVSDGGDLAEVVRDGDTFDVEGIKGPGKYTGSVDLLPDAEGGDVEVTATVRDAVGWPLVVLVLGLLAVQGLERYQKRSRPRRDLARRLAHLLDRARLAQDRVGGRLRICRGAGGDLYLDRAADDALARWDRARADAEWRTWDADGASFRLIEATVEGFGRLADDFSRFEQERERQIDRVRPEERLAARRALEESPVGDALRPTSLRTAEEIGQVTGRIAEGRAHLSRFARLYRDLNALTDADVPTGIRSQAQGVRAKLLRVGDLDPIEEQTEALQKEWDLSADGAPAGRVVVPLPPAAAPSAPAPAPSRPPARPSTAPPGDASGRAGRAGRALAGVAAGLVVLFSLTVLTGNRADRSDMGGGQADPEPVTSTPTLPDAPVATPSTLAAAVPPGGDAGPGATVGWGFAVPLAVGAALVGVLYLVVKAWRRRHPPTPEDYDSRRLEQLQRGEDLRFGLASGVFVVASGMSLLYFPKETFGSVGDYLSVALWGTAVGEGVQLARRLLPFSR